MAMAEGVGIDIGIALGRMLEATRHATGEDFFLALSASLAEAIGVSEALVARLEPDQQSATTVGWWRDGVAVPQLSYPLAGTPCADVHAEHGCFLTDRAWQRYPQDRYLVENHVETFIGAPIFAPGGARLGHLTALDTAPRALTQDVVVLFQAFADRAASEMLRIEAERRLQSNLLRAQALAAIAAHLATPFANVRTRLGPVLDRILEAADVSDATVYVLDKSRDVYEHIDRDGAQPGPWRDRAPIPRSVAERFLGRFLQGPVVTVADAQADPELAPWAALYKEVALHSVAGCALRKGEVVMGFLAAFRFGAIHDFDEDEKGFLHATASLVTQALLYSDAANALRASEARHRAIVTQCQEGIWTFGADGICRYGSDTLASLLRSDLEALLGKGIGEHLDVRDRALGEATLSLALGGQASRVMVRLDRPGPDEWWVELSAGPLDDDGAGRGAVVLVSDIRERLHLEEQARHALKPESLAVLSGGVAHDFNNLLAAIVAYSELAAGDVESSSDVARNLHGVLQSAHRAADLTRQLMDYAGGTRRITEKLQINELIVDLIEILQPVLAKEARVVLDLSEPLPAVDVDATQLRQVLMNLVTNANDALEMRSGTIRIRTQPVAIRSADLADAWMNHDLAEGPYISVEVSDTGSGMTTETRERIFDPFFTTKTSGRGLGLAAVLGILKAHRGTIRVKTTPGGGSSFEVLLPTVEVG